MTKIEIPELERMDWENCKDRAAELIRGAKIQLIDATMMYERAVAILKQYPKDAAKNNA